MFWIIKKYESCDRNSSQLQPIDLEIDSDKEEEDRRWLFQVGILFTP